MSNFAIIGSVAANYHFEDFPREANDLDIIAPEDVELPGAEKHWYPALQAVLDRTGRNGVATKETLYTIKFSHAFWNVQWDKTIFDLLYFQEKGIELDEELYTILYKLWIEVHGEKQMSLEMDSKAFFNEYVVRKYDHDSLHASVAYYDQPLYETILRDGEEVAMDAAKLEALSHEDKIKLAREEVYATALERWMIPSDYQFSARMAYNRALKLTVTSLTKGKFAKFIMENMAEMVRPDVDYMAQHMLNLDKLIPLGENK